MWEVILDALLDSLKASPFLLIIYLLIEFLERNEKAKNGTLRLLNGKFAPLMAGGVGLIPQCGFSVMATDLYCQNYLKLGTLVALFVATSDEALPILLVEFHSYLIAILFLVKVIYAVGLGYLINLFDKRVLHKVGDTVVIVEDEHGEHDHSHEEDETDGHTVVHISDGCCHHEMAEEGKGFWNFVKHPLLHTLKIFLYIFAVNVVFGLLLYYFGKEISSFTGKLGFFQIFFTAAIGLVPNCASSVILAEMYSSGIIGLASMFAGLVSNSGIALAILFKQKDKIKRNSVIVAILYFAGVLFGMILSPWFL